MRSEESHRVFLCAVSLKTTPKLAELFNKHLRSADCQRAPPFPKRFTFTAQTVFTVNVKQLE